ncbi:DUF4097 family beta strand repeat-containing protein [Cellulomonas hominis]|uniref:DUF4097 family beta strand repeat-containing protein n=1 Tax=Cellulomonas hominis TaxID=156981 RepID=UPI001BA23E8D|nr:DUF4097 family beta strand repeat-containing protein [Cellulomonas hominis]VTR76117.1 hypothetical protein CHMI_00873 [Cellulomonas hominis]
MQTFPTPHPISAVVDVPAGRVRLVAADRADTTVEVRPGDAARGRDVKAAERTTVEFRDGVLRVATAARTEVFGPSGTLDVTIHLPAGSAAEVLGSAGTDGVGRLGDVTVQGSSDGIRLDEAATVRLSAAAGDVVVGRLTGPGEVSTTQGDIRVAEALGGTLELRTQQGDITVGASAGVPAALDAGTGLGRISNALRNDGTPVLDIRATTSQGDITARSL